MNKSGVNNKDKKSKSNSIPVFVIIIVLAVLIIAFVIIKNKSNTINNESNENKNTEVNSTTNSVDYVKEIENGVKLNTSSKLNEAKEVGGLKFSNIQLTTNSGITTLLADVTNVSGASTKLKNVQITLLDKDGKELTTIKGVVGALEANGQTQLNVATTSDYINAYDFTIKVD